MMKEGAGAPKKLSTHKFVHAHVDLHIMFLTFLSMGDGTASVQLDNPAMLFFRSRTRTLRYVMCASSRGLKSHCHAPLSSCTYQ
jgi:hypothetical protein